MKRMIRHLSIVFCLCLPLLVTGQDNQRYRAKSERAAQIAANVERTIAAQEPKWWLKKSRSAGSASIQIWKSGPRELELRILVYDSAEEASRMLDAHGVFSVSISQKLEGLGEEARSISHPYFSWVGVRQGPLVAEVQGPGKELELSRRFAEYALKQMDEK